MLGRILHLTVRILSGEKLEQSSEEEKGILWGMGIVFAMLVFSYPWVDVLFDMSLGAVFAVLTGVLSSVFVLFMVLLRYMTYPALRFLGILGWLATIALLVWTGHSKLNAPWTP